jgi:hypothetical protein
LLTFADVTETVGLQKPLKLYLVQGFPPELIRCIGDLQARMSLPR